MRQIVANCERPELVVISGMETKPCQNWCCNSEERFCCDRRFIVHLYARDSENSVDQRYLGALTCWYVNADSVKDTKLFAEHSPELAGVMQNVNVIWPEVDNLAVVTDATFVEDAAYADLELAFGKLYCIMCSVMCNSFKNVQCDRMPAIYFDFTQMKCETGKFLKQFIWDYKDGDVRKVDINDGKAWFIHKIPWQPPQTAVDETGIEQ